MTRHDLDQLIYRMVADKPDVTEHEIAAQVKVKVTSASVDPETLQPSLDELRAVRISPILTTRIVLDNYADYEFWFDTGQESVHYQITSAWGKDPEDQLARWMEKFRDKVSRSLKLSNPSM
jgi:hypothetical protein